MFSVWLVMFTSFSALALSASCANGQRYDCMMADMIPHQNKTNLEKFTRSRSRHFGNSTVIIIAAEEETDCCELCKLDHNELETEKGIFCTRFSSSSFFCTSKYSTYNKTPLFLGSMALSLSHFLCLYRHFYSYIDLWMSV